jgi:hypothetical protein
MSRNHEIAVLHTDLAQAFPLSPSPITITITISSIFERPE